MPKREGDGLPYEGPPADVQPFAVRARSLVAAGRDGVGLRARQRQRQLGRRRRVAKEHVGPRVAALRAAEEHERARVGVGAPVGENRSRGGGEGYERPVGRAAVVAAECAEEFR